MAHTFSKLGLSADMSYSEVKTALRKQKQTWTTRESNGSDKIRREAEAMTDMIAQLREFLEQISEDSVFVYAALASYAFFLEKDSYNIEKVSELIIQASQGDSDAQVTVAALLAKENQMELAEEWVPRKFLEEAARAEEQAAREKEAEERRQAEARQREEVRKKEEARKQEEARRQADARRQEEDRRKTEERIQAETRRRLLEEQKKRKARRRWAFLILMVLAIGALTWFGPVRGNPIRSIQILADRFLHREGAEEYLGEQQESSDAQAEAGMPDPLCLWDFTVSTDEVISGFQSDPYGDCLVVDILGDGSLMAASFDGDGDYLDLGRSYNMSETFTLNVALCCLEPEKDYSSFFSKYETNSSGPYAYSIHYGHVNCWVTTGDGSIHEDSNADIQTGVWYLITIVRDGDRLKLYVNGEPDLELDLSSGVNANEDLVTIGRQALMFSPERELQFTGFMRRVDIYGEALTEEQIRLYSKGLALDSLPVLKPLWVNAGEAVPLWGALEDGSYEVLDYIPDGAVTVYLEDVSEDYIRVSWHGLIGNVDRNFLNEAN